MTTYILLGNYTEQGSRRIRESPARLDKARAILREMGGDFRSFNLTMGRYDFVAVYEASDDAGGVRPIHFDAGGDGQCPNRDAQGLPGIRLPRDHPLDGGLSCLFRGSCWRADLDLAQRWRRRPGRWVSG